MKNIFYTIFLLLIISLSINSCNKDDISNQKSLNQDAKNDLFMKSVAFIQNGTITVCDNEKFAYLIEIIKFDSKCILSPVYKINDVEFCDNGLFNDEISGDGVYTSVELFNNLEKKAYYSSKIIIHKNEKFKYFENLDKYLFSNNKQLKKLTFGCDVSLVDCPNTNFWNSTVFGEPCINFTNCHFELELF